MLHTGEKGPSEEDFGAHSSALCLSILALCLMQQTWLQSLGWEDPLEEGMATHSSILDWRIPMGRGAWWATLMFVTPCSPRGRKESHVTEVTKHSGWCDVLIPFGCLSFQVS